ncbi:hypothetical protein C0995_012434 [Termitomyces sp. Mi166|nr:hypothetical protein C0995_012434 [Termitomyces sp. Mi166\
MPSAYATFANILALTNPETKCQYHLSELTANGDFTQVKTPFPKGFLPTVFVDPHLKLLVTLRFIFKQGLVNKKTYMPGMHLLARVCNAQSISMLINPRLYEHSALTLPQKHNFLATQETSPPAAEPGPSTSHNLNKRQAINPQQTPLSSLASSPVSTPNSYLLFPLLCLACEHKRDKGKGKAVPMPSTEDNSMVVNSDLVNPSEGNVDADGELVDFLESPKELAEKKDA